MTWVRRLTLLAAAIATVLFGTSSMAHAVDSTDLGWLYSIGGGGRGYFDSDLSGSAGVEQLAACDVKTDGRSTVVVLWRGTPSDPKGIIDSVKDVLNNGNCTYLSYNMAAEETRVFLETCDFYDGYERNCAYDLNGYA